MTQPALRPLLETILQRRFRRPCRIARLSRRMSPYSSSYSVEELDVRLDNGRQLRLALKDLSRHTMLDAGRAVRPAFLYDPRREIQAYRHVLRHRLLGTPLLYGVAADGQAGRYWLLIERVIGLELRHVGSFAVWQAVAAWIGRFHREFERRATRLAADPRVRLIRYDDAFMWLWLERARRNVERGPTRGRRSRVDAMRWLSLRYRRVVETLAAQPPTIIHGELFASNVIVESSSRSARICVLDWETIAVGHGLVDLAALASGHWTDDQRGDLLRAYQAARAGDELGRSAPKAVKADVMHAFDCSQLHLAIRMIGWSSERVWEPPADHAQDWLAQAMRIARQLRF